MDIKLKRSKQSKQEELPEESLKAGQPGWTQSLYRISCVMAVILCDVVLIGGSMVASMLRVLNDADSGYYDETGTFQHWETVFSGKFESSQVETFINGMGIAMLLCAALFVICIVTATVYAGCIGRRENGKIHMNWFDKIWSEIHIAALVGIGVCAFLCAYPLYEIWAAKNWFGIFKSSAGWTAYDDTIPFGFMIALMTVVMTICVIVCIASYLSLVKKLKAKMFWEYSLLGGTWLWIYRGIKNSDNTMLKILCVFILAAFLSATGAGLPVVLVLILVFVPKTVKKYMNIRDGVQEVKNGNLTYQIPVSEDHKGVRGELDRLAADINEISQASNIAVKNELKNQRMKTELISNVSHDLKTPLTSMVSYIDLIKKEGLDSPNAPEYLQILDEKTQRLRVLTENLFEAAKASSGAIPVNMETIDLGSLVSQSLGEMSSKLENHGLEVIVSNGCENENGVGPSVRADGQLLWRVIENLLGNISKYALENSRVYVDIRRPGVSRSSGAYETAEMSAVYSTQRTQGTQNKETNGEDQKAKSFILMEIKNISRDKLNISADELTERFKRGDESRNTEGSGLGLAIAKDLTTLMDGIFEISIDGDLFKASVMLEEA